MSLNFLKVREAVVDFEGCELLKHTLLSKKASSVFLDKGSGPSEFSLSDLGAYVQEMPEPVS